MPSADRVLLDATAVPLDRGGVGRYVDALVPALVRAGVQMQVACLARDSELYEAAGAEPIPLTRDVRRAGRMAWEQAGLPVLVRRRQPDVVHSPHYTQPLLPAGVATAVTLHDATFFSDSEVHGRVKGPFFRAATRLALRRADIGVVPSQATADELVRFAGARFERLAVAHHGVDPATFSPPAPQDVARARAAAGLEADEPYIAFLGTLEPRKNLSALVRGYAAAAVGRDAMPALVLAGGTGWDTELDRAIDSALADAPGLRILRPGYLPLADLAGFLGGAHLVAYPSLGEGFGLPVLEAMACGAPVLTTRRLALPEVGGDAVEYCGVEPESIGAALMSLLGDPSRRAALGAAALARSQKFTWDACAQAHLDAYDRALRRHRKSD